MNGGFITVSQLNGYIKSLFEHDDVLGGISVCGEISNIKYHASGHVYLTLKDENSTISAVMFRSDFSRIDFVPENGMRVIASGRVGVYERSGQYQLYISYMKPDGLGQLYMALEALKRKLAKEGLFDPDRKKKLPEYPRRIGVVTSSTGAVIRDIIKVSGRRYPLADIVLYPVHVQGDLAAPEICTGIEYFNIEKNVDVLIVGRGGGSVEDLWAFNNEAVVRAVANSSIPVISAVGHQTDVTLCDLAADCTAGTPSMAAELAVPDSAVIYDKLSSSEKLIRKNMHRILNDKALYLDDRTNVLEINSPKNRLSNMLLKLEAKLQNINSLTTQNIGRAKLQLSEGAAKLSALSPLAVLARGYGFVQDEEGKTVTSANELSVGQEVRLTLSDGVADAQIKAITPNNKEK